MGVIYLGSACACSELAHQHQSDVSAQVSEAQSAADAEAGYREMEDGDARKQKLIDPNNPWGSSSDDTSARSAYGNNAYASSRGAYGGAQDDYDNPFAGVPQHRPGAYA